MAAQPDDWQDVDDWVDEPAAPARLGSGEPRRGAVPSKVREAERQRPKSMSERIMGPTWGTEAENKATADAGAALLNIGADATVNLPGNLLGFGAKVAGQVGRNFDSSIDPNQWRENVTSRTTLPRNARGDEVIGEMVAPAVEAWQKNVTPTLEKYPLLGAAAETAGTVAEGVGWATGLRSGAGLLGDMAEAKTARVQARPYNRAPVAEVAQRYTVVPEDAQHSAGLPTQGDITGSTRASLGPQVANTEVPVANVRKATQNAAQDMPGQLLDANGRVDAGLLRQALDEQSVPYQQVAQLPPPGANTLAGRVRQAWESRGGSLKGDAVAESRLGPLMDPNAPPLPTDELLRRWREINGYASDLRKQAGEGSAAAQIKADDLRSIAESMLDEIELRAEAFGSPTLVAQLKEARVNIARLHTLDDALDSVGWVDPTKLAAMADRHVPLTGGLAQVALDAKAAPRSLTPMRTAINAQDSELDRFGRQPGSWMRNVAGHLGGNVLARRGVEALNKELRAGSGLLKQPTEKPNVPTLWGPNEGPQPSGIEPPSTPWYGPLSLEPDPPPGFFGGKPEIRTGRQLAEAPDFSLEGVPPGASPLAQFEGDLLPWEVPDNVPPLQGPRNGDFASQLGQVPENPGLNFGMEGLGMSARPRGVAGPRSAQLSDPRVPRGLSLMDDTPPQQPAFGAADEFAAPEVPGSFSELWTRHVLNGDIEAPRLASILEDEPNLPLPLARALDEYAKPGPGGERQRRFLGAVENFMGSAASPDDIPDAIRKLLGK